MPPAKQPQPEFGSYVLDLQHREDGLYHVADSSQQDAEIIGVVDGFSSDQMAVMQARAYAHGYKLIIEEGASA